LLDGLQSNVTVLTALAFAGEKVTKSKEWPRSPRGLSGKVDRAATSLRRMGIDVSRPPRKNRVRPIVVRKPAIEED
jgi:hypothetical protein